MITLTPALLLACGFAAVLLILGLLFNRFIVEWRNDWRQNG